MKSTSMLLGSIVLWLLALMTIAHSASVEEIALYNKQDRQKFLVEGAKREGKVSWYTSLIVDQVVRPVKEAFEKEYPFLQVEYFRGNSERLVQKMFAEYQGNAIGMFDPKTERITEWKVPTPWSAPYDAVAGRNGEAWTGSMLTDRVSRLDIKSGQYTEYMLPRPTNIRRVYMDDSKRPGTLWIGSNHGASIVKVEPLE